MDYSFVFCFPSTLPVSFICMTNTRRYDGEKKTVYDYNTQDIERRRLDW
jgi:hypothetical protein